MTDRASEMRDSSPPEATWPGRGEVPAWPATRNSTCSLPCADGVAGDSVGSKRPLHGQRLHGLGDQLAEILATLRRAVPSLAAAAS